MSVFNKQLINKIKTNIYVYVVSLFFLGKKVSRNRAGDSLALLVLSPVVFVAVVVFNPSVRPSRRRLSSERLPRPSRRARPILSVVVLCPSVRSVVHLVVVVVLHLHRPVVLSS